MFHSLPSCPPAGIWGTCTLSQSSGSRPHPLLDQILHPCPSPAQEPGASALDKSLGALGQSSQEHEKWGCPWLRGPADQHAPASRSCPLLHATTSVLSTPWEGEDTPIPHTTSLFLSLFSISPYKNMSSMRRSYHSMFLPLQHIPTNVVA